MNKLKNQNKTLIDRVTFSNVSIAYIENLEKLVEIGFVENTTSKTYYSCNEFQRFTRLKLKNAWCVDELVASAMLINQKMKQYCYMTVSIKDEITGNLNCFSVKDYVKRLEDIRNFLVSEYGIYINLSNVTVKEIELNRTFPLVGNFKDYYRPICLIMSNLPYFLAKQKECKENNHKIEYESFYAFSSKKNGSDVISKSTSKNCIIFKIYNKTKQMKRFYELEDDFIRFEITLRGAKKIKNSLETNIFSELNDEKIEIYFQKMVEKLIIKPLKKWKMERDRELLKLIRNQMKDGRAHWVTNVLRLLANKEIIENRPFILDVDELLVLLDFFSMEPKKKYKLKQSFRSQARKYESAFVQDDDKKIEEIISKLTC